MPEASYVIITRTTAKGNFTEIIRMRSQWTIRSKLLFFQQKIKNKTIRGHALDSYLSQCRPKHGGLVDRVHRRSKNIPRTIRHIHVQIFKNQGKKEEEEEEEEEEDFHVDADPSRN
jgi:hypothetical protein